MRDCLYLFFFVLHFGAGCIISADKQTKDIWGYTGGSVVLPCSCTQPQSTVPAFTWQFHNGNKWMPVFEDEKYSGRLELFNETSPSNLSLLISDLRKENEGYYKCVAKRGSTTTIQLTVKECELPKTEQTFEVTGYSGESVVLPCSCTEILAKPEQIQWMYLTEEQYKEIYEIERLKNRVKLLNQTTPGNLSLHISDLSTEDQGNYYCSVSSLRAISFKLNVEEKPHVHTISSSTDQPANTRNFTEEPTAPQQTQHTLQYVFIVVGVFLSVLLLILLALITWRCRVGRNVKKVTSDGEQPNKVPDIQCPQDEVMYSAVVHVKTASTAPTQTDPEEFTEYARINVKR